MKSGDLVWSKSDPSLGLLTIAYEQVDGRFQCKTKNRRFISFPALDLVPLGADRNQVNRVLREERARRLSKYDVNGEREEFQAKFDINRNPSLLAELESRASMEWEMIIGSGPEGYEKTCNRLIEHGVDTPKNYVRLYENGHDAKFDLLIPDPRMPDIDIELGIYFNPRGLLTHGRYQLSRAEFALRVISRVKLLEIGESISRVER